MPPSSFRCPNCGAKLASQFDICHSCDRESEERSADGVVPRVLITIFMCALAVLGAYGLYDYYHAQTGLLAAFYTYLSIPIGIFIPAIWIFFPAQAAYLTIAAMGLWGMFTGFANLSARSFLVLLAIVTGYALLLFLDKRFPNLFPSNISENSILIPAAFWMGWWFVMREDPVAFILGGGFMFYLTAGVMLAYWRPEVGKRIGIKFIKK